METEAITAEVMRPLLGQEFTVHGHDIRLELTEVETPDSENAPVETFILLFEGPTDIVMQQGNWTLRSADAEFTIFLVPIGPRSNGTMGYEAVFSRLIE